MGLEDDVRLLRDLLRRIARGVGLLERGEAACCGLTLAQCHALGELVARDGISAGELARSLKMDPGAVTRVVDALVDQGLVWRDVDPVDRRVVRLGVTAQGRQFWSRVESTMLERSGALLRRLPSADRASILAALEHLARALEEEGYLPTGTCTAGEERQRRNRGARDRC